MSNGVEKGPPSGVRPCQSRRVIVSIRRGALHSFMRFLGLGLTDKVPDPSGARRWIVRVTVKGQKNRAGKPLRTDFGLGGVDLVPLQEARAQALEYRRKARAGLDPRTNAPRAVPTFEAVARQVLRDRLSTWKNPKHQEQWINTLSTYAEVVWPGVYGGPIRRAIRRAVRDAPKPVAEARCRQDRWGRIRLGGPRSRGGLPPDAGAVEAWPASAAG